jgi:hypothetical protein
MYRSKAHIGRRGGRSARFRAVDEGAGAVLGPYEVA